MVVFNSVTFTAKLNVTLDSNLLKIKQTCCTKLSVVSQAYGNMYCCIPELADDVNSLQKLTRTLIIPTHKRLYIEQKT
jgi:hypothetical protein